MAVVLDTNAVSAFFDGDAEVVSLLAAADGVCLPVIVIGEYRYGLRRSQLRQKREPQLLAFARSVDVPAVQESTTLSYAAIKDELRRKGNPIPENDIWISALALEYGCSVISRDQHFDVVPQLTRMGW